MIFHLSNHFHHLLEKVVRIKGRILAPQIRPQIRRTWGNSVKVAMRQIIILVLWLRRSRKRQVSRSNRGRGRTGCHRRRTSVLSYPGWTSYRRSWVIHWRVGSVKRLVEQTPSASASRRDPCRVRIMNSKLKTIYTLALVR